MKQQIYNMFKSGCSTNDIYSTFINNYERAKTQYRAEERIRQQKEEQEKKEKAARQTKSNTHSTEYVQKLAQIRTELVEALYNYFDFLMDGPLDYDITTSIFDAILKSTEKSYQGKTTSPTESIWDNFRRQTNPASSLDPDILNLNKLISEAATLWPTTSTTLYSSNQSKTASAASTKKAETNTPHIYNKFDINFVSAQNIIREYVKSLLNDDMQS